MELLSSSFHFLTQFVDAYGYAAIFLLMTLESACIPVSSEVVMLFSGFMISRGVLDFWGVVFTAVFANFTGSMLTFYLGRRGGRSFILKYGRYIFLNREHLAQSERYFSRHGAVVVFLGRNLPIVRTFVSLPAGIAQMNPFSFAVLTLLGCIPWNFALTYLGKVMGENWALVEDYSLPITIIIGLVILAQIIRFILKGRKNRLR